MERLQHREVRQRTEERRQRPQPSLPQRRRRPGPLEKAEPEPGPEVGLPKPLHLVRRMPPAEH